jgi:intracellular multiplication protein IcmL
MFKEFAVNFDLNKTIERTQMLRFAKTPKHLHYAVNSSILANLIIFIWIFIIYANPLEPKYFSTSFNGEVKHLVAINEPNTSDYAILQWANIAAISAYTYDFVNFKSELKSTSQYFTENGWDAFVDAIDSSNNLQQVLSKKLIVNAVATNPPVILQKGLLNGVYSWRIQIPILVTYQAASGFNPQNVLVTMLVSRIPTLESYRGVGIEQFNSFTYDITTTSAVSLD